MKIPTLEQLLSRDQKEQVIKTRLAILDERLNGEIHAVSYDRRFAFDFEVVKGPAGKARVTFALSIEDPRFPEVLNDCAQACFDIRFTSTHAKAIRGALHEEEV